MQNPAYAYGQLPEQTAGWRRYAGVALAIGLNGALIWALANGLAVKLGIYTPPVLQMKVIDTPQPQQQQQLPPVQPQMQKMEQPQVQVPEPVIQVAPDPDAQTIQVPQQTQPSAPADASASGMTSTHTTPPYPSMARQQSHQGTVILTINVGPDGSVTADQIATSSGFPELDQAALDWVKAHWRYKPAMQGGAAIASVTQAAVKFDLKQAH